MSELIHGSDVMNEQKGAYLTEIKRYESLLLKYDSYQSKIFIYYQKYFCIIGFLFIYDQYILFVNMSMSPLSYIGCNSVHKQIH